MGDIEPVITGEEADDTVQASLGDNGMEQALDLLEQRVRKAVDTIAALRRKGAELEETIKERDETIGTLKGSAKGDAKNGKVLAAITKERDLLLHDRSATAGRVEVLLQRLDKLGIE